ncbi:MAG: glutamyl-tRNA amidotransferase [Clostridia bacterium]|nr:glutamyl-tRNA amidotransferase [Clostridia bacterium]
MNNLKKEKEIRKGNTILKKVLKRGAIIGGYVISLNVAQQLHVFAADDPISVVNNLSNFIFGLIRAVGMIILGFGVVQVGMSLKSHDPSQRANGIMTLAGGIVITFAKEILNIITGG